MTTMRNRFLLPLTLMLLLLTTAPSLFAQSTWDGGGDGTSWNDPLNWDTDTVPLSGADVIFNTNTTVTVTNIPASPYFVNNFTVSSGTVTLNNNLDIHGNLSVASGAGFVGASGTTITFNGTTTQSIGAGTFDNLVIDKVNSTSTTVASPFSYTLTNPISATGNLTVNNFTVLRGAFSFCSTPGATFTHNITNITLGGPNSTLTGTFPNPLVSNTEILITNTTSANVTVNVSGNFTATTVANTDGGLTFALVSPLAGNGGTCTLNVAGNFNVTVPMVMGGNGFRSVFSPPGEVTPFFNLGTTNTSGTGDFIISNSNSIYISNTSGGAGLPTFTFVGGTTATPAIYNVPFNVFGGNFGANASRLQFINGVYQVPSGSSLTIADRTERFLQLNGTLIIENGGGIDAMSIGIGANNPVMIMAPNARLIVRSLAGLGDGTGPTAGQFAINQAGGGNAWDLTSLQTNGTIEYAATAGGVQNVTPFTYNVLEMNRPIGNYSAPTIFNNPFVATGNITVDTLRLLRGVLRLTDVNTSIVRNHTIGTLEIGSSGSITTSTTTNTGIFVNSHNNGASSTLTVTGNTTVSSSATGGVSITAAGAITSLPTFGSTTLTFQGNLTTDGSSVLWLSVNAAVGTTVPTLNLQGNVQLSSDSRINLNPPGTVGALVNLGLGGGSPITFDVQPVSLLGTLGPPPRPANARGSYVIVSGSEVVLPTGAALAVMNPGTLTVNGTLICQDGAELIATLTGTGSGGPTLIMGTNGTIRVADVDGLGDGTPLDPTSNFPLFICRTSPGSGTPGQWVLSAINTAGTIEYNGTGQTVTPRNGSNNYFNLVFSGGNKTLGGNVDATNSLALNGGIITTTTNDLTLTNASATSLTRTNGHINGLLVRAIGTTPADYFYPIGDASTYRPITLTCGASSASPLRGEVVTGNANSLASVTSPLQSVSFNRYYRFTNTGSNSINVTVLKNVQVSGDDGIGSLNPNNSLRLSSRISGSWAERALTTTPNTSSLPIQISSNSFAAETITASGGNYF
jgi:hypothetical protein